MRKQTRKVSDGLLLVDNSTLVDIVTGNELNASSATVTTFADVFDPEVFVWLYDDFASSDVAPFNLPFNSALSWNGAGTTGIAATAPTLATCDGDGASQGSMFLGRSTFFAAFDTSMLWEYRVRVAQFGAAAGTRRFGLGAAALTSDGTGIYFRHTNAGDITAVARTGASESTASMGVSAANGTFHDLRMVATDTQSIDYYIDGVLTQTIATANVPTTALGISFAAGSSSANTGVRIDYIDFRHSR